jgi:ketosteroid isomerase-like protein
MLPEMKCSLRASWFPTVTPSRFLGLPRDTPAPSGAVGGFGFGRLTSSIKTGICGKRLLIASALIVVIVVAGCASAPPTNPPAEYSVESLQIKSRLQEIFDAAEKQDLSRLDSYHLYGPKFTKFPAAPVGRQDSAIARKGEHEGLGAISALTMQADDLKIDIFGNAGIATFVLNSRFKAGGEPIERQERATLVFVKDHGAWKIAHEHFSPFKGAP